MNKILFVVPTIVSALSLTPAFASGDAECKNISGEWLSYQAITEKVTKLGYQVRKVETDDSCYEVYALDKNGNRVEIYMHPVTGTVVKLETKY